MTAAQKQDSNVSGLRFCREVTPGALSGSDVWKGLEPNSFKNWGGTYKTVARQPINASRQRKKGVMTDLTANGEFVHDLTYGNVQDYIEGLFFADLRTKHELAVTAVSATLGYEPASGGDGYAANDLVFGKGFGTANDGLKLVTGTPGASSVEFAVMTAQATAAGTISKVGFQFATGDAHIDASGTLPQLKTTTKSFADFGLVVGEWVYLGDDSADHSFIAHTDNNQWARIQAIATHALTFDKSEAAFTTDTAAAQTLRIYFGRVCKNETGSDIKKYTYQFERTLGAPDDSSTDEQAEYLVNAMFEQWTIAVNTADKVTCDVLMQGCDYELQSAADGLKGGTRPTIESSDAFNTSSDVRRVKMSVCGTATPLFAYLSDVSFVVKNNLKANKAVSVLGAFSQSPGFFECSSAATAYFADVASIAAVRANSNVTLDMILARENQAIVIDLPLIALGGGQPSIVLNEPITLALTSNAATGVSVNANADYTILAGFFDYVPTAAQ